MKRIDAIGKKYGKLTVIEEAPKLEKCKGLRYKCLCECGNIHEAFISHLVRGTITHCGCTPHKGPLHHQWTGVGYISGEFWYTHIIRSATGQKNGNRTRKPKELGITIEYAWDLFLKQDKKCALSGLELYFPTKWKDKSYNASLDRIDSSKGYIEGNVQWVHKDINIMKNKFNNEYFIKICNLVSGACSIQDRL